MRIVVLLALLLAAAAQHEDEPAFFEEDTDTDETQLEDDTNERLPRYAEEPAEEPSEDAYEEPRRYRRDADEYEYIRIPRDFEEYEPRVRVRRDSAPCGEYIRVKRRCDEGAGYRVRRSTDYVRAPRQVHQYEVHEPTDEAEPSSVPYEQMLAASAEHHHRVYASPGAPAAARYMNPEVSVPMAAYLPVPSPVLVAPTPSHHTKSVPINVLSVSPHHPQTRQGPKSIQDRRGHPVPQGPPNLQVIKAPVALPLQSDQELAGAHHHKKHHSHGHAQGGGQKKQEHHHEQQGGKTTKGFKKDHQVDKGGKGFKTNELHKKEFDESQGIAKKHRDQADHKGNHEEEAHGHRGAKFDEKKGHKKGHKTKGYHNKYHKDEFHKEHKFYDDYHKSGEHHRYGKFNAKHASNESGKKKAHHVNAGHDVVERGKKGYSNKGHVDSDHKGHKAKQGHEEHHHHQENHARKGGKEGGKQWGYEKKN